MINEIDYIDVLVNALNTEVDDLMNQIDTNLVHHPKRPKRHAGDLLPSHLDIRWVRNSLCNQLQRRLQKRLQHPIENITWILYGLNNSRLAYPLCQIPQSIDRDRVCGGAGHDVHQGCSPYWDMEVKISKPFR